MRRHIPRLLQKGQVNITLNITHQPRILIPAPSTPEPRSRIQKQNILRGKIARLQQSNGIEQTPEARADDDNALLLDSAQGVALVLVFLVVAEVFVETVVGFFEF